MVLSKISSNILYNNNKAKVRYCSNRTGKLPGYIRTIFSIFCHRD